MKPYAVIEHAGIGVQDRKGPGKQKWWQHAIPNWARFPGKMWDWEHSLELVASELKFQNRVTVSKRMKHGNSDAEDWVQNGKVPEFRKSVILRMGDSAINFGTELLRRLRISVVGHAGVGTGRLTLSFLEVTHPYEGRRCAARKASQVLKSGRLHAWPGLRDTTGPSAEEWKRQSWSETERACMRSRDSNLCFRGHARNSLLAEGCVRLSRRETCTGRLCGC